MSTQSDHVIISSKDMLDPLTMNPSRFTIALQSPIEDFEYFQLISVLIPNTYYNVTDAIGNKQLIINGDSFYISDGNYNLISLMAAYTAGYSQTDPSFNITFNPITSVITMNSTTSFTADFTTVPNTALTLGYLPVLYTSIPNSDGSYDIVATLPPSLSPLGILINMDCVAPTTSTSNLQGLRSSSFMINNNTNSLDYTVFNENSQFSHSVRSNFNIINTIQIKVFDLMGNVLQNLGHWNCILRFVRQKPTNSAYPNQKLGYY